MSTACRLFCVFVGGCALLCARRTGWFEADRWLLTVGALLFIGMVVADVMLWWPL